MTTTFGLTRPLTSRLQVLTITVSLLPRFASFHKKPPSFASAFQMVVWRSNHWFGRWAFRYLLLSRQFGKAWIFHHVRGCGCSWTLQIQDSTRQDYDPSIGTCSLQVHRYCSACTTATGSTLDHLTVPSHHSLHSSTSDLLQSQLVVRTAKITNLCMQSALQLDFPTQLAECREHSLCQEILSSQDSIGKECMRIVRSHVLFLAI